MEEAFWGCLLAGGTLQAAVRAAGVGRSTGYRWLQARFVELREEGRTVRATAARLRVSAAQARVWEQRRRREREQARREGEVTQERAVRSSARHAELLAQTRAPRSDIAQRDTRYWELMPSGLTNTAACKVLGVHRKTGNRIRRLLHQQSASGAAQGETSGRYLSLRERLQIADLLRLGHSMRAIAVELAVLRRR